MSSSSGVAFWSLLAFTVVLFLAPQHFFPIPFLGKLTAGFAIASHMIAQASRGAPLLRRSRPLAIAGALLAWILITTPFSIHRGGSVTFLLDEFLKVLSVFALLGSVVDRPQRLRRLFWAISLMSLPISLTAISNYGSLGEVADETARIAGYDSGLAANPNDLAVLLNILLPIAAGLAAGTTRALPRLILLAIVGLDATAVIATFSRAGLLALVWTVGLCLYTFARRGRRALIALGALVIVVSVIPLPRAYQARVATIWSFEDDGSARERSQLNINALRAIARSPIFGNGIGMDAVALNRFQETWRRVHNVYLEYAVDLGLPGLVLFVWLFLACLRCLGDARRGFSNLSSAAALSSATDGVRIGLLSFAVSGFFGPVAYQFYFYYTAGLALAVAHVASNMTAGRLSPSALAPTRQFRTRAR